MHGQHQDFGERHDPFEEFTGDRSSAAHLRANLTHIAAEHAGTEVARIADQVLAGRRPIRDLADDPTFSPVLRQGMDDYRNFLASLTPAERAELVWNATHDDRAPA